MNRAELLLLTRLCCLVFTIIIVNDLVAGVLAFLYHLLLVHQSLSFLFILVVFRFLPLVRFLVLRSTLKCQGDYNGGWVIQAMIAKPVIVG